MQISKLFQDRLDASSFSLSDIEGKLHSENEVREKYIKIKSYFKSHLHPSEIIAIKIVKDIDYLLCMLASMELGITYIPMKDDYPLNRVEQIQKLTEFKLLIDGDKLNEIYSTNHEQVNWSPIFSNPLYIIFTSGSTGEPKGVVISRKAAANYIDQLKLHFDHLSSDDNLLQITQFTFDISLNDVFLFLLKNCKLYFSKFSTDIFNLAYEIEEYKINFINTVPNNLSMLLNEHIISRSNYSSVHTWMIGGARFSAGLHTECVKHLKLSKIYNVYGPTECTIYSHFKKLNLDPTDLIDGNVSIGKPLENIKSCIYESEIIKNSFVRGELLLGGLQLMDEYIKNPTKTKSAFLEIDNVKYYRTGDISYQTESGEFHIVGRLDDTIKYRGYRINLLDIDSYIQKLDYVRDCVSIAVDDELLENKTIAYIILKEERLVKEIKKDLMSVLLDYQIPSKIIITQSYPVNTSGKVCKKTLKENFLAKGK